MLAVYGLGPRASIALWSLLGFLATVAAWSVLTGDFRDRYHRAPDLFSESIKENSAWPGFEQIENVVVFGDSYSTTYFNPRGPRPTLDAPFGNHDLLLDEDQDCNTKWIQYLQSSYNSSVFKVTNLAGSGALIEGSAYEAIKLGTAAPHTTTNTLKEEINVFQGSKHTKERPPFADWKNDTTLFASWFGFNEVFNALEKETAVPYEAIFATYGASFDRLYRLGARHFLIMNVPPIDTLPQIGLRAQSTNLYVTEYNQRLNQMHKKLVRRHTDAKFFLFDVHSLWLRVIRNPGHFTQYAELENVSNQCPYDAFATDNQTDLAPKCYARCSKYFWLDHAHPTPIVHKLTAAFIASDCFGMDGRRNYCTSDVVHL